jgi:putative lipoprotein
MGILHPEIKFRRASCNLIDQNDQPAFLHFNGEIICKAGVNYMLMRKFFILIMLLASAALAGCGSAAKEAAITGVIAHAHPMTLPDGYVISILIEDITKADAPGKQIAEQVITSQGVALPMPFEVVYDPGKINPKHTYGVLVKIEDESGNLLYTNTASVPVITNGNPTQKIEIIVDLVDE